MHKKIAINFSKFWEKKTVGLAALEEVKEFSGSGRKDTKDF